MPDTAGSALYIIHLAFGVGILRVHENSDRVGVRSQLAQQLQPFWLELLEKRAYTRDVAAGTMQAADEAAPDRVAAGHEDDWYSRGRSFGRKRRWIAADCNDDGHLPLHEISDQRGQSIVLAIGPTIIDDDVSITDESGFTEGLLEQR